MRVRTVSIPFEPAPILLRALYDVRSMVNRMIPEWSRHPEESRFDAIKRSYRELRPVYSHLGSKWALVACNETLAALNSWSHVLRRTRKHSPMRFDRIRFTTPRRHRLKASLHPEQYRLKGQVLDITVHPSRHVQVDLSDVTNPLFERYLRESTGKFGLSVTKRHLHFHFHTPQEMVRVLESVGVDLNLPSMDYVGTDGLNGSVDLGPICRVQGAMTRKRISIQRAISKDLRHRRAVLRRYGRRERNRVAALAHAAANEFLTKVGNRNVVFEDLGETTLEILKRSGSPDQRRRIVSWNHVLLQRIVSYKSRAQVVRVNPRGTSSECPRCGGPLAHPSWRRATCEKCQGDFHRDRMAAVAILSRGQIVLWGAALPPNVLNELLEVARWRPEDGAPAGPSSAPMKVDEAKSAVGLLHAPTKSKRNA
ncbi:MAG: zinc ribbon domain-containing protein [Thermoplasmata archaeon]